ncbi:hypothetical protein [Actinomadura rubrisoli]|uniref:Uncharacterized protein n=1 Tax=Actinomadura rubrisoli TaxID=2530368 RepID=A0A4R5BQU9_9ACTN|nr:hypothetical protein [Actinomadura rubrisoli]TDD88345.1 hypothetical protein E1298_15145 [Actinomadura rubrisoli]
MTTGPPDPPEDGGLQKAIAAYQLLMDEIVPESQYYQGKRENPERIRYLGGIIERHAARERERRRTT